MGYDLKPRNKELDWFSFGAFGWTWFLSQGAGLLVGHGPWTNKAGRTVYGDKLKRFVDTNDGYYVTANKAKSLAEMARTLTQSYRWISEEFTKLTDFDGGPLKDNDKNRNMYNFPVRKDWLDNLDKFADWAENSGGFGIW